MAYDIGPQIGIDGEKEFNNAIKTINSQIRTLKSEMNEAVSAMAGMDDAEESVSSRTDILGRTMDATRQKISLLTSQYDRAKSTLDGLGEELESARREFGSSSDEAARAEAAYNRQARAVNDLGTKLNNAKTDLNKMNSELGKTQEIAAENSTALARLNTTISSQQSELSQLKIEYQNVVLSNGKLSSGARSLANTIKVLSAELSENQKKLDETSDSANKLDKSYNEAESGAQGLGSSIKNAFTSGAVISAASMLLDGVQSLIDSTSEYTKILGTLEVSSGKAGYSTEQTAETFGQLYGVIGDTQQAATAAANLQALGLEQSELTRLTDMAIGAWATYGDSIPIDSLAESINETIRAGQVTGTFADVLNWAGTSEDEFNEKLAEAGSESERVNLVMEELAKQGLADTADAWRETNGALVDARQAELEMQDALSGLAAFFTPFVTLVKGGLAEILGGILSLVNTAQTQGIQAMFQQMQSVIASELPNIAASGLSILTSLAAGINEAIPSIFTTGAQIITSLVSGFMEQLPQMAESAVAGIAEFLNGAAEELPKILDMGVTILQEVISGILETIPAFVQSLPQVINAFVNFITSALPQILSTGVKILTEVGKGIIETIPTLVGNLPQVVSAIVGGFVNLMSDIVGIGKDIVEGIWEGIKNAKNWLLDKVSGWADGILDGIKGFFGINSPSTVMRDQVGKMLMEGMAAGISRNTKDVVKAADGANRAVMSAFAGDIAPTMTVGTDLATNGSVLKAAEATINSAASALPSPAIVIPVNLNGRTIAEVIYDPLRDVAEQRGYTYA